jgi:hypothetical protein
MSIHRSSVLLGLCVLLSSASAHAYLESVTVFGTSAPASTVYSSSQTHANDITTNIPAGSVTFSTNNAPSITSNGSASSLHFTDEMLYDVNMSSFSRMTYGFDLYGAAHSMVTVNFLGNYALDARVGKAMGGGAMTETTFSIGGALNVAKGRMLIQAGNMGIVNNGGSADWGFNVSSSIGSGQSDSIFADGEMETLAPQIATLWMQGDFEGSVNFMLDSHGHAHGNVSLTVLTKQDINNVYENGVYLGGAFNANGYIDPILWIDPAVNPGATLTVESGVGNGGGEVPEPATFFLALTGLGLLARTRRS